ncbi:MAG TPA: PEP-CTERM sorting domain-containing protein [Fimbriimonadales bacterium]|jgi:hypothetical protein|nr:PEP-CTERM sorting domain-containing protein [Fimbriimonadales bacterium]
MKLNRLAFLAGAVFCAGNVFAVWYGGDPDLVNGLAIDFDAYTYDDFDVTGGGENVNYLMANVFSSTTIATANWEIRSGITNGNGGTLVASGTGAVTQTPNGFDAFGFTGYKLEMSGMNVNLSDGRYYVGWNVGDLAGQRCFVQTTSGANGVGTPIGDGDSWFNSPGFFFVNFGPASDQLGIDPCDFSYGVNNGVPEPATFVAIGLGLAALVARRRK